MYTEITGQRLNCSNELNNEQGLFCTIKQRGKDFAIFLLLSSYSLVTPKVVEPFKKIGNGYEIGLIHAYNLAISSLLQLLIRSDYIKQVR